jgi:hypothetical protein
LLVVGLANHRNWQNVNKVLQNLCCPTESLVTPWLITCWLVAVVQGLRRGHAALRQFYNLDGIHTSGVWEEAAAYFGAFGLKPKIDRLSLLMDLVYRYSRRTGQFLFGTPSQHRSSLRQ